MNAETEDNSEGSSQHRIKLWIYSLGVILVMYVQSSGPVLLLIEKGFITLDEPWGKVAGFVYNPLEWAYRKTPLHRPLGIYWHFWAPTLVDIKGDPIPK